MKLRKQLSCFGIAVAMSMLLLLGTVAVAAGSNWQMYQSQANQGVQQYALTSAVAAGQPLTISSRLQLDLAGENSSMLGGSASVPEQIVLAGLSTTAGARPTQLAVVWQLDVSSWFPTWNLYLISEADLLPSPNQHLKLDTDVFPLDGEEYSTLFSYDPVSGALSVRVVNETKSAVVYAGNIRVKSTAATLYPGVAAQSADSKNPTQITVQELKTAALFAPVGANVQVKSRIAGTNFLATMRAVDRRDEWVLDVALPSVPLDAPLRLLFDDGHKQLPWLDLTDVTGNQLIPVDPALAPAGDFDIVLTYEMDGQSWELSRTPLKVGTASVAVQDVQLGTDHNGAPVLLGTAQVTSDGLLPPFKVQIAYELSAPGALIPLHSQWQRQTGQVQLDVESVNITGELPFQIPLERVAGVVENNELFLTVALTADLNLPFFAAGRDRFVIGQRPAAFPKIGPYTVLRGDFHTHSTESDGDLSPADRVWETYMYGYDIIALTDHRNMRGYDQGAPLAERLGLVYVRGFETGINGQEHLVVLGVDEEYQLRDEHQWARNPNEERVYYRDQVRTVIDHGGFIFYAHPGGTWLPPGPYASPDGPQGWTEPIEWMIEQGYLHGVETRGAYGAARRNAPYRWALEHDLTLFDVSDIHGERNFNAANQTPVTLVLVEEESAAGVLEALREGRTLIHRNDVLRGTATWLQPFLDTVLDFELIERNGTPTVQITNASPLVLYGHAQVDGDAQRTFWLTPYGTVYLTAAANAQSVSIRWGNVQSGPDIPFNTTHSLK